MTRASALFAGGGGLFGVRPPAIIAGKFSLPDGYIRANSNTVTLTASRYYYAYKYVDRIETFSGVKFHDSGAGNNGKKVKVAAFTLDQETGAPNAVAKSFGEVTLDGTAGIETMASSWTPSEIGWHLIALTSDSDPVLYSMARGRHSSAVGQISADVFDIKLPPFATAFFAEVANTERTYNHGEYVDGTYTNFPEATPVAPTTSLITAANTFPLFGLYK